MAAAPRLTAGLLAAAGLTAASVVAARRRAAAGGGDGRGGVGCGLPESVRIVDAEGPPRMDAGRIARSVQAAEVLIDRSQLDALWSPAGMERLALTYWRFLPRVSRGLIQVRYTPTARLIVLVGRPLVLLSFGPAEYELDAERGLVRWRIRGGLLLSPCGRPSQGSLQIGVHRLGAGRGGGAEVHVEVAVTDFMPTIARVFGQRFYAATQSRIHVMVTHAFLRSLAGMDLAPAAAAGAREPR